MSHLTPRPCRRQSRSVVLPFHALMRSIALGFAIACLSVAAAARADVRLTVAKDGSKVISNISSGDSGPSGDLNWLAKQRNRRSAYDPIIDRYSLRYGVDAVLVRAVIQVESNFDPTCVSNKGARGLMQLMPETARRYGVKQVHDPDENIRGGVQYLADLLSLFSNDLPRSLAAYNAAEGTAH